MHANPTILWYLLLPTSQQLQTRVSHKCLLCLYALMGPSNPLQQSHTAYLRRQLLQTLIPSSHQWYLPRKPHLGSLDSLLHHHLLLLCHYPLHLRSHPWLPELQYLLHQRLDSSGFGNVVRAQLSVQPAYVATWLMYLFFSFRTSKRAYPASPLDYYYSEHGSYLIGIVCSCGYLQ